MLKIDTKNILHRNEEELRQIIKARFVSKYTTYTKEELFDAVTDETKRNEWAIEWMYSKILDLLEKNKKMTKKEFIELVKNENPMKYTLDISKESRKNWSYYEKFCHHNWVHPKNDNHHGKYDHDLSLLCPYYEKVMKNIDDNVHEVPDEESE